MTARLLLCIVAGHRWQTAAESHETFPVLRCARCERTQRRGLGTHGPEGWSERAARGQRAESLLDAREQPRR